MRIAVVSPFVDRGHGTERALAELIERLARNYHCEIHLYAQRIGDITLDKSKTPPPCESGGITWHKVHSVPGPHLLQFFSWLFLNRAFREYDRLIHGLRFDVLFSPGINCFDANVILVHAVFRRLRELQLSFSGQPLRTLHRRLYHSLLSSLEGLVYGNHRVALACVSQHTASQLRGYFGRDDVLVVPNGVDTVVFNKEERAERRAASRRRLGLGAHEIALLMIGNDWCTKGLSVLLEAAALCNELPLRLLIVGQENPSPWLKMVTHLNISERVSFFPSVGEVLDFYAAADVYVAPSLEDSFNLPVLEAMACGLPAIVSKCAGISEWVHDGIDGLLLGNPRDKVELAFAIRKLLKNPETRIITGENAARTASSLSWDLHAERIYALISRECVQKVKDT